MRQLGLIFVLFAAPFVATGAYLIIDSDRLVRTEAVGAIADKFRWPGIWACGPNGCIFSPDFDNWRDRLMVAGWSFIATGTGLGAAAGCFWQRFSR